MRIAPPHYLFAPVKGRSYIDNANVHRSARSIRLLDLKDFFPNCSSKKVFWFFSKYMECSPDVSAVLTSIVTKDGCLPQGSPCSSILAYLCYVEMWDAVSEICEKTNCDLSVYADDITISGDTVPEKAVFDIKSVIRKHGHTIKASKERSKFMKPAEVTGIIISNGSLKVPNRQNKSIFELSRELRTTQNILERKRIQTSLAGRRSQISQISRKSL